MASPPHKPLLDVKNLGVTFATQEGFIKAVNGISFSIAPGEILGVVGESGSGKSQLVMSLIGLLAKNGRATGHAYFKGQDLIGLPKKSLNKIRGNEISMVFQDAMTSLNPYLKIPTQMVEVLRYHKGMDYNSALNESIEMLERVKIVGARDRIHRYPHEFSGGMRQRVMIAMGLLCKPPLLIADEPTTALDVTVQAQIVSLLMEIKRDLGTAIILITHNLGVVAGVCDSIMVMYAGSVMEYADTENLFYNPKHPYTQGLIKSIPKINDDHAHGALPTIKGAPPSLLNLPKGCPFSSRCDFVFDACSKEHPQLFEVKDKTEKSQNNNLAELSLGISSALQHNKACFLSDLKPLEEGSLHA